MHFTPVNQVRCLKSNYFRAKKKKKNVLTSVRNCVAKAILITLKNNILRKLPSKNLSVEYMVLLGAKHLEVEVSRGFPNSFKRKSFKRKCKRSQFAKPLEAEVSRGFPNSFRRKYVAVRLNPSDRSRAQFA